MITSFDFFGIKELYDVEIKLRNLLDIDGTTYEPGETLIKFDKLSIASFSQQKEVTEYSGGHDDLPLIFSEFDSEFQLNFSNGITNLIEWALISNSKIKTTVESISVQEVLNQTISEEYLYADLKHMPNADQFVLAAQANPNNEPLPMGRRNELSLKLVNKNPNKFLFLYDNNMKRIPSNEYLILSNRIYFTNSYPKVFVNYTSNFDCKKIENGDRLNNLFYSLSAKTTLKLEENGKTQTMVIKMPKIKILSNLNFNLGENLTNPSNCNFSIRSIYNEEGTLTNKSPCSFIILDQELTGEYI